ncbi:hypothetical protein [Fimbriiglobus ruber]|uniref:hypothetical protein n=1 Tax=Fimbriiglobus ruber TaxID=1908690 RepID=UPI001EE7132B|nr:hypothetical protein [Fimbriiglobus ruber]
MTEVEWLAATNPDLMLQFLLGKSSERKQRLFECACCYRIWQELTDARSRTAVIVAEQYSDGLATDEELESASLAAEAPWTIDEQEFWNGVPLPLGAAAYNVAIPMGWWGGAPAFEPPSTIIQNNAKDAVAERTAQAILLRDIFNPFRAIILDPTWQSSTVLTLASGIYTDRAFDRLPILADALEEAGCDDPDLLNHCRSEGPHARGCWAVDLLLGKE